MHFCHVRRGPQKLVEEIEGLLVVVVLQLELRQISNWR